MVAQRVHVVPAAPKPRRRTDIRSRSDRECAISSGAATIDQPLDKPLHDAEPLHHLAKDDRPALRVQPLRPRRDPDRPIEIPPKSAIYTRLDGLLTALPGNPPLARMSEAGKIFLPSQSVNDAGSLQWWMAKPRVEAPLARTGLEDRPRASSAPAERERTPSGHRCRAHARAGMHACAPRPGSHPTAVCY